MDKVGNLFSTLMNAQRRGKLSVHVPFSKLNRNILQALKLQGYIQDFSCESDASYGVSLGYIRQIQRVSRPGKRVYLRAADINKVKRGLGILLLSTSKGIMSDQDALHLRVGGEALCYIV